MDVPNDVLYQAASVWKKLTEYCYVFTYGYKKQLRTINSHVVMLQDVIICVVLLLLKESVTMKRIRECVLC